MILLLESTILDNAFYENLQHNGWPLGHLFPSMLFGKSAVDPKREVMEQKTFQAYNV